MAVIAEEADVRRSWSRSPRASQAALREDAMDVARGTPALLGSLGSRSPGGRDGAEDGGYTDGGGLDVDDEEGR